MNRRDAGASTVVGAIIVLAVLSLALVYVNAYHVPRQGAALELEGREQAESALVALAGRLSAEPGASLLEPLPLRPPAARPQLLSGIVISPARAEGQLQVVPAATTIRVSHVVAAPPGGVPPGDPMRVDAGGGLMRVYLLGNATEGAPLGALDLRSGGTYLEPASYRLEGGLVLVSRATTSALVSGPALDVARGRIGGLETTTLAWRVPLLAGDADAVSGTSVAQVQLTPGPESAAGGGQLVRNVTIEVGTTALSAWTAALQDAVGLYGTVAWVATGPSETGTVTATLLPPAGTPAGTSAVALDLRAVRYAVSFGER